MIQEIETDTNLSEKINWTRDKNTIIDAVANFIMNDALKFFEQDILMDKPPLPYFPILKNIQQFLENLENVGLFSEMFIIVGYIYWKRFYKNVMRKDYPENMSILKKHWKHYLFVCMMISQKFLEDDYLDNKSSHNLWEYLCRILKEKQKYPLVLMNRHEIEILRTLHFNCTVSENEVFETYLQLKEYQN